MPGAATSNWQRSTRSAPTEPTRRPTGCGWRLSAHKSDGASSLGIEAAADDERRARAEAQRLKTEARSTYATWRGQWPASGTSEDPDGLRAWLGLMSDLRTLDTRCSAQQQEVARLDDARRSHRDALARNLTEIGAVVVAGDLLDAMVLQAQAELSDSTGERRNAAAAEDRRRVLETRNSPTAPRPWKLPAKTNGRPMACASCWAPSGPGSTNPEAALSIITRLDELAGHLAEVSGRSRRIAGIDRRCEAFLADLESFRQAAPDIPHDPPGDCARALVARASAAESAEQTRRAFLDVRESAAGELEDAVTGLVAIDGELVQLGFRRRPLRSLRPGFGG